VLELGRNRFEGTGQTLLADPEVKRLYLGGLTDRRQQAPGPALLPGRPSRVDHTHSRAFGTPRPG